jgi:ATP-dependent Clp protease, protease subunit
LKKYYSMETSGRTADVYIFGDIVDAANTGFDEWVGVDFGDVSGLSIVNEIKDLDVDTINVHINSCGGYTSEGLAIYNTLKNHPAKVVTYCDGFACSAASLVFMAGNERIMGAASALMIHNAWSDAEGNAAQLRQQADVLEKISQAAGNAYAEKVTISREELDALLDGDNHEGTWILPDEAVKMGFATAISSAQESGIANQSAMRMILQKLTAKPQNKNTDKFTVALNLDARSFYAELEKAKNAAKQAASEINEAFYGNEKPKSENNPMNFLSALAGRKE